MDNKLRIGAFCRDDATSNNIKLYENPDGTGWMIIVSMDDFSKNTIITQKDATYGRVDFQLKVPNGILFREPVYDRFTKKIYHTEINMFAEYNAENITMFAFNDLQSATNSNPVWKTVGSTTATPAADYSFLDGIQKMLDEGYFALAVSSSGPVSNTVFVTNDQNTPLYVKNDQNDPLYVENATP